VASVIYSREEVRRGGSDEVNRLRHARYKSGEKLRNIAKDQGVSLKEVRQSIHIVDMFDAMFNAPALEAGQIRMMNDIIDLEEKTVRDMLQATRKEKDDQGNEREVPDYETRAKALDWSNDRLQILIDKRAVKTTTNIGIGVQQTAVGVTTSEGSNSFEKLLRDIQSERAALPAAEKSALPAPQLVETLDVLDAEFLSESADASKP
jgi:hypothetical protein